MANRAIEVVKNGEVKITPKSYEKVWFDWLENIQDWCLSRQLWWGHRVPAYKISDSNDYSIIARNNSDAEKHAVEKYGTNKILQDEDVLDTWFSSSLFPFYSLGWPDKENLDLKHFFPGHLLETGHDIIFFWVARMVMMSLALTDKVPFKEVYLHPIVRDNKGKKMSKSLGNVIDPLQVIDGCTFDELIMPIMNSSMSDKQIKIGVKAKKAELPDGIPPIGTDALRFSLLSYMIQPNSINVDLNVIVGYRLFNNKLWNAAKFIISQLDEEEKVSLKVDNLNLTLADKWIMVKLDQ